MIEFKNYKTMSVEELDVYKSELTNDFEKTKEEIMNMCKYLEELDSEYLDTVDELNRRANA